MAGSTNKLPYQKWSGQNRTSRTGSATPVSYRATPLPWCGRSPSELLMGRKIRSTLPTSTMTLTPQWPYLNEFRQANQEYKQQQKRDFDERHRVRDLPDIPDNTDVWITTNGNPVAGRTVQMAETPQSKHQVDRFKETGASLMLTHLPQPQKKLQSKVIVLS